MTLTAAIALMIVLVMPNGESRRMFIEQPSIDACFDAAKKFMQRKPEEFKAIAIGAGCVVHPRRARTLIPRRTACPLSRT